MVDDRNVLNLAFNTRYVYNSNFVNRKLLDRQYINRLKSVCKHTSQDVSYSDMVKRQVLHNSQKNDNQCVEGTSRVSSTTANSPIPRVGKIVEGKMTGQDGNPTSVRTGLCVNRKNFTDQCVTHVNTIKPSAETCKVLTSSVVHSNRFAILGESIENRVCDFNVESQAVNRCQNTRVNHQNGTKLFHEGKNAFTVSMLHKNPVQRGHDSCFSPGNNLDLVVTQSVDETPVNSSVCVEKRGVCWDNHSKRHEVTSHVGDTKSNVQCDKYAFELNTSLKDIKMQVARKSEENVLCMQQNSPAFGFIPIYGLGSRVIDRKQGSVCNDILQLHNILRSDGRHNYAGLQIPVPSKLNYDVWGKYLTEYWDWQLPVLIKYGFPLDFDRALHISSEKINHKSATSYPDHMDAYLKEEIDNKAMLGSFNTLPIKIYMLVPS